MKNNVAVIAAHPDDEVLGCGGTIAKHALAGDDVYVLIVAEGITSRDAKRDRDNRVLDINDLKKAARAASQILGVASVELENFPDNRLDSVDLLDLTKTIEKFIENYHPSIVYTHHSADLNVDHQRVHDAVITACRPTPACVVSTLLFFEVASSTEWRSSTCPSPFLPNWFSDISSTLDLKLKALKCYHSEMRSWPHARSLQALEHLARWRGASVGIEAAEAFVLGRRILK